MINTERRIKLLAISNILCWGLFVVFIFSGSMKDRHGHFKTIDVERINIINEKNNPVMVLSSKRLIPGPTINGKTYPKEITDGRLFLSGIIFFNDQGDEVGGLIYNGFTKDSTYSAVGHLSFDQWKQNQVVAMQYIDNGKSRRAGFRVWDRPTNVSMDEILDRLERRNNTQKNTPEYDSLIKEIQISAMRGDNGVERMFIGSINEVAQIQLKDKKGNVRGKFFVDTNGEAKLEFMDAQGKVTAWFPN